VPNLYPMPVDTIAVLDHNRRRLNTDRQLLLSYGQKHKINNNGSIKQPSQDKDHNIDNIDNGCGSLLEECCCLGGRHECEWFRLEYVLCMFGHRRGMMMKIVVTNNASWPPWPSFKPTLRTSVETRR
jgi:hypothetical protein